MRAPDYDDRDMRAGKNIQGWLRTAHDVNVAIVLVGPISLAAIPWLINGLMGKQHVYVGTHIMFMLLG